MIPKQIFTFHQKNKQKLKLKIEIEHPKSFSTGGQKKQPDAMEAKHRVGVYKQTGDLAGAFCWGEAPRTSLFIVTKRSELIPGEQRETNERFPPRLFTLT